MRELLGYTSQYIAHLLPQLKNNPILITGTPRSGTTFVGEVLSNSPELRYVYEPLNPDFGYPIKDNKCIICGCKVDSWYKHITKDTEGGYYKHFKHLINSKSLQNKTALLKAPFSVFASEWLVDRFNVRPIVMYRNPLSFVSSIKRMKWPVDFEDFLNQEVLMGEYLDEYRIAMMKSQQDTDDIIGNGILQYNVFYSYINMLREKHPDWLFVRLEDISENPVDEFEKIFNHFELDFNENIKKQIIDLTSADNPTEAKVSKIHSLKRNSKDLTNIWKKRLTDDEVKRILKETKKVSEVYYPELYK
jgi:hypothetical protein